MKTQRDSLVLLAALAFTVLAILGSSCTEKLVNSRAAGNVALRVSMPVGTNDILDSIEFLLTVLQGETTVRSYPMQYKHSDSTVVIAGDSSLTFPGGESFTFRIDGYDSVLVNDVLSRIRILSGDTTFAIAAGEIQSPTIMLKPATAMIRLMPPLAMKKVGDTMAVDVVVYNIPSLSGVTVRIDYDSVLKIDTVLPTANTNHSVFEHVRVTPHQKNLSESIAVSALNGGPLFKLGDSGPIATIVFTVVSAPLSVVTDVQALSPSFYGASGPIYPSTLNDDPNFAGLFSCYVWVSQ